MVKKGPCSHCRVTYTPLWHNGPADKPVLCNDCGSQYKLKGHLDNYLPKNLVLQSFHNKFINVNGGRHLNLDVDQLSNYVPPTSDEVNNKSTPNVHHISAQATPLWRNGLAEKSVLHNACGSQHKSKGHLDNYPPKKLQLQPLIHKKNFINANGGSRLNVEDEDQLSNPIPPASDGDNNKSTPNVQHISPQDFGNKTPSRKRSRVVYLTPLDEYMEELWKLHRNYQRHVAERILVDNVNNFIPENEIGLGAILLKTDHDVAASTDTCESSTDN